MAYTAEYIERRNEILGELGGETFGSEISSEGLFTKKRDPKTKRHWIAADIMDAEIFAMTEVNSCGGEEEYGETIETVKRRVLKELTALRKEFETRWKPQTKVTPKQK